MKQQCSPCNILSSAFWCGEITRPTGQGSCRVECIVWSCVWLCGCVQFQVYTCKEKNTGNYPRKHLGKGSGRGCDIIFVFNIHVPHTQREWEEGEDKNSKTESLARRRFVKALRTLPHSRAPVGGPASWPWRSTLTGSSPSVPLYVNRGFKDEVRERPC